MSTKEAGAPDQLQETERVETGPGGPGRGPMGGAMIGQKANSFGPSTRRLVARMRPERHRAYAVVALTVVSVVLSAIGPKILGRATDLIFSGLIGGRLPEGTTKAEAIDLLRQQGEGKVADMVSGMDVVPGQGVDFNAVGDVLLIVLAIYVVSSLLAWFAG